jgi:hypothetical protein
VLCGSLDSGLTIRDFDTVESYNRWSAEHQDLARTLPTVRTRRGFHVWFRSNLPKLKKLGDGEYRGNGYTVAPPSIHTAGRYDWINPLPRGELQFVPSNIFIPEHNSEKSESHFYDISDPSDSSEISDFSEFCVSMTVEEVIAETQPERAGARNAKIMDLARGLRYNAGLKPATRTELRNIVEKWHARALAVIATKEFDETWIDFDHAWSRARHPLHVDLLAVAAKRADKVVLPHRAEQYGLTMQRLVRICIALAELNATFWISSHKLPRHIPVEQTQALKMLKTLENDGILQLVERGNQRRATRYLLGAGIRKMAA